MAKIPNSPDEILQEFAGELQDLYGEELLSITLFGSGAAGTYVPKKSDINFLVVLTDNGIARLAKSFEFVQKWHKRNVALPLFMTLEYIKNSLDSFPIEFLNMKKNYKVVYGKDVLEPLKIEKENLRLQCESQVKGKLLHLRESFLSTQGNRRHMQKLIKISLAAFATLFKALLILRDETVPVRRDEIVHHTAIIYQLDQGLFTQLLEVADDKSKFSTEELIKITESYIIEISKLALAIDNLK